MKKKRLFFNQFNRNITIKYKSKTNEDRSKIPENAR